MVTYHRIAIHKLILKLNVKGLVMSVTHMEKYIKTGNRTG